MPTRRQFLGAVASQALPARRKPDILYITSDQQRRDELSCLGNRHVRTPHLDWMAREGAGFEKAFVQFPVCLPSRTSMLTGLYAHAHGIGRNEGKLKPGDALLPDLLKSEGYFLGATGVVENELARHFDEYDYTPALRPKPAPELHDMDRTVMSAVFAGPEDKHWDVRCLRAAQRMVRSYPHPQFLYISFHQPHRLIAPLERFARKYDPARIELPASYRLGPGGRSESFRREAKTRGWLDLSEAEVRTVLARRLASAEMLDSFVGEIRRTLEETGRADNTIVIYQSDHGDYGGEFGCLDKSPTSLADALIQVPMVLWAPGRLRNPRTSGKTIDALVQEIDVMPTLLELAGISIPPEIQGRSLVPLAENKTAALNDAVFSETNSSFGTQMVRTLDWKLVTSKSDGNELYNLRDDPGETRNLFGTQPDIESRLNAALASWRSRTTAKSR